MDVRRIGVWSAFAGVCLQLGGLGLDGIMHARDIELAANEGIFTLTNPSHAMIFLGISLTIAGVLLLVTPLLAGAVQGGRPYALAPAAFLVLLAGGVGGIAITSSGSDHDAHSAADPAHMDATPHADATAHGEAEHKVDPNEPTMAALLAVLKSDGIEAALKELNAIVARTPALLGEAHTYSHELGRQAFVKYGSAKIAFPKCDQSFQSGCYHGVLEAHFQVNPKVVPEEVATLCDVDAATKDPGFVRFQCVHGLGHGLLQHEKHDLQAGLKNCDYLKTDWDRRSCWGGAFMENIIFARDLADGHAHSSAAQHEPSLKADDPHYPCNAIAAKYVEDCYLMQTSAMLMHNGYDFAKAAAECAKAPAANIPTCYQSLGRDIAGQTLHNTAESLRTCSLPEVKNVGMCLVGVVKNFIDINWETDEAFVFCKSAPEAGKSDCYRAIGEQLQGLFTDTARRETQCARSEATFVPVCRRGAGL